jgi:hypothetical protein
MFEMKCAICKVEIEEGQYCDKHAELLDEFFKDAVWVTGRNQEEEACNEDPNSFHDDLADAFRRGQVIFSYKHNSPNSKKYHMIAIGEFKTHYQR